MRLFLTPIRLALLLAILFFANSACAATITWKGPSFSSTTSGASWVGNVAPVAGDDLIFPVARTGDQVNFSGTGIAFKSIGVTGGNFTFGGSNYACPTIDIASGSTLTFRADLKAGVNAINKTGLGTLAIDPIFFLNVTITVTAGIADAIGGGLSNTHFTVQSGATLRLDGALMTSSIASSSIAGAGAAGTNGALEVINGAAPNGFSGSPGLTLTADTTIFIDSTSTLGANSTTPVYTMIACFNGVKFALTANVDGYADTQLSSTLSKLDKNGTGGFRMFGTIDTLNINSGIFHSSAGAYKNCTVFSGATFRIIGNNIAPGPGSVITCDNLILNGPGAPGSVGALEAGPLNPNGVTPNNTLAAKITLGTDVTIGTFVADLDIVPFGSLPYVIDLGSHTLTFQNTTTTTLNRTTSVVSGSATTICQGAGSIVCNGTPTVNLNAPNAFTGGITVNSGTLFFPAINAVSTLADTCPVTIAGGTLDIGKDMDLVGPVTLVSGTITGTTGFLGAPSFDVRSGTVSAILHDGAVPGTLTKTTGGTVTLSRNNSYTGTTTVNAGTLAYGANDVLADSDAVTVSGGTLDIGAFSDTVGAVTLTSGSITGTTGILTGASYGVQSGSIGAILAGAGAMTKSTTGTVTLSGTNTYSGLTSITGGILNIQNSSALGSTAAGTSVSAGTLQIQGGLSIGAEPLTLAGTGAAGTTGALENLSGVNSYAGAITVSSATIGSAAGTLTLTGAINDSTLLTLGGAGAINLNNVISGAGGLAANGGTDTLGALNSFSGGTTVNSGSLVYGIDDSLNDTGAVTVSGGTLNLGAFADTVGAVTLTSGTIAGTTGILTGSSYDVRNGSISAILAGTGALTKTTAGTVTLTKSNTYSGGTNVSAGTLAFGANNVLLDSGALNMSGGIFSIGAFSDTVGAVTLASGSITGSSGVLTGASYGVQSGSISAILGGAGALTKSTGGTVTLSAVNTYSGGTNVNAGTLAYGANNVLLDSGVVIVAGGTLDIATFSDTVGAVTLSSGAISGTSGVLTGASYGFQSGTASAILAGAGVLTKTTAGTVVLAGANTYSGATNIAGGVLNIRSNTALGSTAAGTTVSGGALLQIQGGIAVGAEALSLDGTLENVSGSNSFGGAITLAAPSSIATDIVTDTLTVSGGIANGGSLLTLTGPGSKSLGGAISGAGGVTQNGGATTLSGANTYAGLTTVAAGLLKALGASTTFQAVTINAPGTFQAHPAAMNLKGDFTNSGTFNGNGGTANFNSGAPQNLALNAPTTFNNLGVGAGTTLIETIFADNATVAGTLANSGVIRKAKAVSGNGALPFGLTGVALNVTAVNSLSNMQVDRIDSNHPNAPAPIQTGRYWTFTAAGSGVADVTLPHNIVAFNTAQACRYTGAGVVWDCGRSSSTATTVTENGVAVAGARAWSAGSGAAATVGLSVSAFSNPRTAGVSGGFTVNALDGFGNVDHDYRGTISFASSDGAAALPANYSFTAGDSGTHAFNATLKSSGIQSLTGTDTGNAAINGTQFGIVVNAAAASHFILALPAGVSSGTNFNLTVTALDAFNNVAAGYTGTVNFSTSDALPSLPASYTFGAADAGVHVFSVNLASTGPQSITATDSAAPGVTGTATTNVANVAPVVDAGADASVSDGTAFSGSGSFVDPGADIWTATVNYGDGSPTVPLALVGKTFSLNHLYPGTGTYSVTVSVSDNQGGSGTDTLIVTVQNIAPLVDAGADASINEGGTFASAGTFVDPGVDTWTATVDYGDGSGAVPLTLTGKTFALGHLYADAGVYTVTVEVADGHGGTGTDTALVTALNVAPTVAAGPDAAINEGSTYTGSGTFADPGVQTWTATVDYGDGSGVIPLSLTGKTYSLSHLYADASVYTVTVVVTDSHGGVGTDTVLVTVANVAPAVAAGPDAVVNEGSTFTGAGTFTDPGVQTWTATVDYGDGSGVVPLTLTGKTYSLSHLYVDASVYTVTVVVTDSHGGVGTDTVLVTVANVAPAVAAGPDAVINEGSTFTGAGTFTDPGVQTWTATVDYGDGSGVIPLTLIGKAFSLSHPYGDSGTFTVVVKVTDAHGGIGTGTLVVNVSNVSPMAAIVGAPAVADSGTALTLTSKVVDPGKSGTFTYAWTVLRDGAIFASGANANFTFTPLDNITYKLNLVVTDSDGGAGTDSKTIVSQAAPTPGSPPTASPNPVMTGKEVILSASATDLYPFTWIWDFGDGTTDTSNQSTLPHTYTTGGAYLVTATATDSNGHSTVQAFTVNVDPVHPLTLKKLDIRRSYSAQKMDSIMAAGELEVPSNFVPKGQTFTLHVGNVAVPFTLDNDGTYFRWTTATPVDPTLQTRARIRLHVLKNVATRTVAQFNIVIKKGDFKAGLGSAFTSEKSLNKVPVTTDVFVLWNGKLYEKFQPQFLTAHPGVGSHAINQKEK